jgi:radical SAM protein with 4Fe4S-binding SPASM domain
MIKMGLPNEIIIELTNRCNLDCDFCFNRQKERSTLKDIPKADVFNILEDMSNSGLEVVRLTGGEPLLRKDLLDILKKAKSCNLYVILNTNASLISKDNIRYFDYIDLVLFSLHSLERFKEIREKMELLKNFNLKIMLATTITKDNIVNIEEFYKFVAGINQDNFAEWFLLRPIPNKLYKKPISVEDISHLYKKMVEYNKKYRLNIKIANSIPFCAIKQDLASVCSGGLFDSGYTRLIVNCRGSYKTDYSSSELLGSIKNKKILEIWNSEKLREIRNYLHVAKGCRKCHHLRRCGGGIAEGEYLRNFSNVSS